MPYLTTVHSSYLIPSSCLSSKAIQCAVHSHLGKEAIPRHYYGSFIGQVLSLQSRAALSAAKSDTIDEMRVKSGTERYRSNGSNRCEEWNQLL